MKMTWSRWKSEENCHVLVRHFYGDSPSKTLSCREINCFFRDVKWCCNASWGLKGLMTNINSKRSTQYAGYRRCHLVRFCGWQPGCLWPLCTESKWSRKWRRKCPDWWKEDLITWSHDNRLYRVETGFSVLSWDRFVYAGLMVGQRRRW